MTWPVICPPTPECTIRRLEFRWCTPQGNHEPTICPQGSFCPNATAIVPCPEGYYCPLGSFEPTKCPFLSLCSEESEDALQLYPLLFLLLLDALVLVICLAYWSNRRSKHKNFSYSNEIELESNVSPSTQVLIDGIDRSRGPRPYMDFEFDSLGLTMPNGKQILRGVTGSIKHGQVTAVLGPSGAGKTTFISTLMGKINQSWKSEGVLKINGKVQKNLTKFKNIIGYVPQEDIMHRELTTWQNLQYSADIKLPRDWTSDDRKEYVKAIMEILEISHVRNSIIGDEETRGVSGGQRKRINIGLEIAGAPLALFCDEPTSGLDSSSSLNVVHSMKTIAKTTGMTVVMIIHQPRIEIWDYLDKILLLAPGGLTVYQGDQKHCENYFERHLGVQFSARINPADTIMDAIAVKGLEYAEIWINSGSEWLKKHTNELNQETSEFVNEKSDAKKVARGANYFKQIFLSHVRSLKQQYMNLPSLILELFLATLTGLLIGFATQEHFIGVAIEPYTTLSPAINIGLLPQKALFICLALCIASASAGVKTFGEERTIYWREAASGHSRSAYFIGVSTSVFYRIILAALHFAVPLQILSRTYIPFVINAISIILLYFCVYGLSSIVSMVVPKKDGPLLAAVTTCIVSLFNGYIEKFPYGLKVLSFAFWYSEAFFNEEVSFAEETTIVSFTADVFGYVTGRTAMNLGLMLVIGIIFRIAAFLAMILLNRDKQK